MIGKTQCVDMSNNYIYSGWNMYSVSYRPAVTLVAEQHLGLIVWIVAPLASFADGTLPGVFAQVNQHGGFQISAWGMNWSSEMKKNNKTKVKGDVGLSFRKNKIQNINSQRVRIKTQNNKPIYNSKTRPKVRCLFTRRLGEE